jgi:hypothetical protein
MNSSSLRELESAFATQAKEQAPRIQVRDREGRALKFSDVCHLRLRDLVGFDIVIYGKQVRVDTASYLPIIIDGSCRVDSKLDESALEGLGTAYCFAR